MSGAGKYWEESARGAEKFMLRMPSGTRSKITEAAKASRRSMNSEIVRRIELTLQGGVALDLSKIHIEDLLSEIRRRCESSIQSS